MKVVIIGAGVAGLSIGWRLLQADCSVIILDRAQPGRGATWAAAGMLAVTAEMEDAPDVERQFAIDSNALWPDFAAELEAYSGQAIGYRRDGALILAADAAELEALRPRGPVLDAAGVAALAPMLSGPAGALWAADEGHVDSRMLATALTEAVRKAGGKILPGEAAVRMDGHTVLTPYGGYKADAVLLAAGAWTGLLNNIPIIPVKGEIIALAPPGAALPGPVIWGNGIYMVPRGGRLLVGATVQEAGFDTQPTDAARRHLRSRAESLIPALRNWTLAEHWAGLRPKSPDGLPLLGPGAQQDLFVASGQYRNGILFAPAIARLMADLIRGQGAVIPQFDPRRFAQETA
jgi:glycine oxidase